MDDFHDSKLFNDEIDLGEPINRVNSFGNISTKANTSEVETTTTLIQLNNPPQLTGDKFYFVNGYENIPYEFSADELSIGFTDIDNDDLIISNVTVNVGNLTFTQKQSNVFNFKPV